MNLFFSLSLLIIALSLVITFSLFCSALLRSQVIPVNILSIYLFSFFNVVLVSEIAGTLSLLHNQVFFLLLHLVLAGIAFLVWQKNGRPPVFDVYIHIFKKYKFEHVLSSIKAWPSVWILALAVGLFYLFCGYLILVVPPNNYDSMTSHMVRVAYWLQHGNFQPWLTWDYTQQVYPINAQVAIMWTVLFLGRDWLAGFPQWLSALTAMVAIFGIARILSWNRIQSTFAALVWAFLPEILLESTTTQNHLVASSFFVIMVYLLFLGMREQNKWLLMLSGISLALALGTHQLIFIALPGLGLAALLFWIKMGRVGFQLLLTWAGWCLIVFLLVGSYMYVFNIARYGNPLATNVFYSASSASQPGIKEALSDLVIHIPRYVYASFDLTGVPAQIADPIYSYRTRIVKYLIDKFYMPIEGARFDLAWRPPVVGEDMAWFGILGFFIFPIVLTEQLWRSIRCKDIVRGGLILISIGYIFCFIVFFVGLRGKDAWSPYQGRYFIIIAALLAPFLASLLRPTRPFVLLGWVVVVLSIGFASYTMLYNVAKPLTGFHAIWTLDRIEKQDLNSWQFHTAVKAIEDKVPADARMGIVIYKGFYEYPFFGKYLERSLIPIYPYPRLYETEWLKQEGINWILLCRYLSVPEGFVEVSRFPTLRYLNNPKGFVEVSRFPAYLNDCSLLQRKH